MKTERDLFKQAYLNLRTADSIPFPDAVFDEYVRLRDSRGYKLVPLEPNKEIIDSLREGIWHGYGYQEIKEHYVSIYKAMIGACDDH